MTISLDRQVVSEHCDDCNVPFTVVRGSVFDRERPVGLYLVALHGHSKQGRLAHVAVALLDGARAERPPLAFAVEVRETADEYRSSLTDWKESPWVDEAYLGKMLNRDAALSSPLKSLAFEVVDHILVDLPEARAYFSE